VPTDAKRFEVTICDFKSLQSRLLSQLKQRPPQMLQERHLGDPTKNRLSFTDHFKPGRGGLMMNVINECQCQPDIGVNQQRSGTLGTEYECSPLLGNWW